MELEYIGQLLPDGHLSIDPAIAKKIKRGQRLKIEIEIYEEEKPKNRFSKEAQDFLNFLKRNTHQGSYVEEEITREFIHEDEL